MYNLKLEHYSTGDRRPAGLSESINIEIEYVQNNNQTDNCIFFTVC